MKSNFKKIFNKIIYYIDKNKFIFFICLLNGIIHFRVFLPGQINSGDWIGISDSLLKDLHKLNLWVNHSNLGQLSVLPNNIFFYWLNSYLFNFFEINWNLFTKYFFLFPIIFFTPVSAFIFFKKISKSEKIAFYSTFFYLYNPFFLKLHLDWLTYAYCWWLLPTILYLIIRYFEKNSNYIALTLSFLFFLIISIEVRVALLTILFSIFFSFFISFDKKNLKKGIYFTSKIVFLISVGIFLHLNWLLGILTGNVSQVEAYSSENIFPSYYTLIDLLSLNQYNWSKNLVLEPFVKQIIDFRIYLVSIFVLIGIYFAYYNNKKNYYFFLFSFIFFIFLSKQENLPFKSFYNWLFSNFPLFNLYRESSKFFIFLALSSSYFFGVAIKYFNFSIFRKNYIKYLVIFVFLLFNTQHFITGKIGGMSKTVEIPNDYIKINSFINKNEGFYRILSVPIQSRWDPYDMNNPIVSYTYIRKFIVNEQLDCNYYLDNFSIKYVLFQDDIMDSNVEIYKWYGNKEKFYNELSKCNLVPIDLNLEKLLLFENKSYLPNIYLSDKAGGKVIQNISAVLESPSRYRLLINNLNKPMYLNFVEEYHPNWSLRVGKLSWFESIFVKDYFIDKSHHYKTELNLNSFYIDPKQLCSKYSCLDEGNGNYSMTIYLYFKSEALFNIGGIVSLFLISIFVILLFLKKILKHTD